MTADESKILANRAQALFEGEIREKLAAEHHGKYVAIEPDSHDYFVADTFSEAVRASRDVHPEKLAFVMRLGHLAAIHLGAISS